MVVITDSEILVRHEKIERMVSYYITYLEYSTRMMENTHSSGEYSRFKIASARAAGKG